MSVLTIEVFGSRHCIVTSPVALAGRGVRQIDASTYALTYAARRVLEAKGFFCKPHASFDDS